MTENQQIVVYKNVLAWRGCEKLYLDAQSCDVYFVVKSLIGDFEKIPAHKCILSAISPVFNGMFYGPHKQDGDIDIDDSTFEAFKEFLQFFYRSSVKLTVENVPEVMNLGKKYQIDDCLKACTDVYQSTLTLDNLCWGYELAILFELNDLKKFCEQKICDNPIEVFQSSSFLNCEQNLLRHILRLDSMKCDESVVFDGCMAWARAACIRNKLNENDISNLRSQLGDLFYTIRFGEMTQEAFHDRYRLYEGFFSLEEFKDITMMIVNKHFRPPKFIRSTRTSTNHIGELVCCLKSSGKSDFELKKIFKSNHKLLLKRLHLCKLKSGCGTMSVEIRINENPNSHYNGDLCAFAQASFSDSDETVVELPSPVVIKPGILYDIKIFVAGKYLDAISNLSNERIYEVHMENGIIIKFYYNYECTSEPRINRDGLITRMDFASL